MVLYLWLFAYLPGIFCLAVPAALLPQYCLPVFCHHYGAIPVQFEFGKKFAISTHHAVNCDGFDAGCGCCTAILFSA